MKTHNDLDEIIKELDSISRFSLDKEEKRISYVLNVVNGKRKRTNTK